MIIVAGNICAGKSTLQRKLEDMPCVTCIDMDDITKMIYRSPDNYQVEYGDMSVANYLLKICGTTDVIDIANRTVSPSVLRDAVVKHGFHLLNPIVKLINEVTYQEVDCALSRMQQVVLFCPNIKKLSRDFLDFDPTFLGLYLDNKELQLHRILTRDNVSREYALKVIEEQEVDFSDLNFDELFTYSTDEDTMKTIDKAYYYIRGFLQGENS